MGDLPPDATALEDLRAIFTGTYGARYEPPKRDAAPTDSGGPG